MQSAAAGYTKTADILAIKFTLGGENEDRQNNI
jgi:hypothetical protein